MDDVLRVFNYAHSNSTSTNNGGGGGSAAAEVEAIKIYPLCNYYFASKPAPPLQNQTLDQCLYRLKSRLQVRNSVYKLPGGRLRPGESDIEGLKRKLTNMLSVECDGTDHDWEIGECIDWWWRAGFETLLLPYLPHNVKSPKECRILFLVKLPERQKFTVPKTPKLLLVPLSQLHENQEIYGPVISGVPQLLSKFPIETVIR